jgi:ribosomal protein S18 acetylase RimI-like enzyme
MDRKKKAAAVKITYYNRLNNTPVTALALRANAEIIECGHFAQYCNIDADSFVFAAMDGDKAVGFLAFHVDETNRDCHVTLSYVIEQYRGLGLHDRMWDQLVKWCKKHKYPMISSATSVHNTHMQRVMARQGRVPVSINYAFYVDEAARRLYPQGKHRSARELVEDLALMEAAEETKKQLLGKSNNGKARKTRKIKAAVKL